MSQTTVPPPAPPGASDSPRATPRQPETARTPAWVVVLRWALIVLGAGGLLYVATLLASGGYWVPTVLVGMAAMGVLAIYGTRRAIPAKYLYPGLLFLLAFQIWPLIFTIGMSFTNYGSGYLGTKEEAIASIEANSVQQVEGSERYTLTYAAVEGQDPATGGDLAYLLTDAAGTYYAGTIDGLTELDPSTVSANDAGKITAAEGYTPLSADEVNNLQDVLADFAVPTEGGGIKALGLSQAFIGEPTMVYDEASDTITNTATGVVYVVDGANFVPQDGEGAALPQGWTENVGFDNYTRAFTNDTLRDGFIAQSIWNFAFAALTVITTFLLGMFLALLFNDPRLKGKSFYRSVLILPYAIPVYVSALVWASMFNQDFGLINDLTGLNLNWLGDPWLAKIAVLLTNLWLGFPYMFIVCTGALQAIPNDVREAAAMDGASWFRTVRSVIMPLLLVAVGPLLIASFAFNFNNFGLIFLLTEGGPFVGGQSQIGSTDLLITIAYRLAFSGSSPNFGFAAAIAVLIFILTALISYAGFRRTRALEDVN